MVAVSAPANAEGASSNTARCNGREQVERVGETLYPFPARGAWRAALHHPERGDLSRMAYRERTSTPPALARTRVPIKRAEPSRGTYDTPVKRQVTQREDAAKDGELAADMGMSRAWQRRALFRARPRTSRW